MIEAIVFVGAACLAGNGSSCDSAEQSYIRQNHLDSIAQKYGDRFKLKHPSIYISAVIIGGLAQRKYQASLWGPIGIDADVSNVNNETVKIYYKIGF